MKCRIRHSDENDVIGDYHIEGKEDEWGALEEWLKEYLPEEEYEHLDYPFAEPVAVLDYRIACSQDGQIIDGSKIYYESCPDETKWCDDCDECIWVSEYWEITRED